MRAIRVWLAIWFLVIGLDVEAQNEAEAGASRQSEPLPVALIEADDVLNIVLLGSDTTNPQNSGRTDVIMVVSVNHAHRSVALLSIPRDLYVYVPGWGFQRINTVFAYGETAAAGNGPALLFETLRYNLGIEVAYYARVDFNDFRAIIDAVGGIDIAVDCPIEDWRLRESELEVTDEANWEMYTLPIGIHHMDGDLALWYVRSRRTSNDIDRGLRQQEVIRSLWQHIRNLGLLSQLPDIWLQLVEIVETDIPLTELASLTPLALDLDSSRVSSFNFRLNEEVTDWLSPEGERVLVPDRAAVEDLIRAFLAPPVMSQLRSDQPTVQIINKSGNPALGQIVANKLAWLGFIPTLAGEGDLNRQQITAIHDYTGRTKGGALDLLQSTLRIQDEYVEHRPDPARAYDYAVIIGSRYYPCTRNVVPPSTETSP